MRDNGCLKTRPLSAILDSSEFQSIKAYVYAK